MSAGHLQGVYGLVSNLGSLVVRTLFQPLEEAAFAAFSAWGAEAKAGTPAPASANTAEESVSGKTKTSGNSSSSSDEAAGAKLQPLLRALSPMVKAVALLGLLAAAFGPSYSYVLLRLVYGTRWSETEAPAVLAAHSVYVLLLALNGGCTVNWWAQCQWAGAWSMVCAVSMLGARPRSTTSVPLHTEEQLGILLQLRATPATALARHGAATRWLVCADVKSLSAKAYPGTRPGPLQASARRLCMRCWTPAACLRPTACCWPSPPRTWPPAWGWWGGTARWGWWRRTASTWCCG